MSAILVYPSDRNGAIRMVETTLSHTQSTLSPYSVHMGGPRSVHVCGHVCGSTCPWTSWTTWHSTSNGVAKGMVERAGAESGDEAPYASASRATRRSAEQGQPGFGTTFSNPLNTV
jgi:hypothetical protein